MNFLSHYYLDRTANNSLFFLGVSTPDLVSLFHRTSRLHQHKLPERPNVDDQPLAHHFHVGICRHFAADAVFHSSEFFLRETSLLARQIREQIPGSNPARPSFIAHIALELLLDRILISAHPDLVPGYYAHFSEEPPETIARLTEWITGKQLPQYPAFLRDFVARKSLYHYLEWDRMLFILQRIVEGVGLQAGFIRNDPDFQHLLEKYERNLTVTAEAELQSLAAAMGPV
jgi:hypothetical protein